MLTGYGSNRNLFVFAVCRAKGFIVVSGPDDVLRLFAAVFRTAAVYEYGFQQNGVTLENIIFSRSVLKNVLRMFNCILNQRRLKVS